MCAIAAIEVGASIRTQTHSRKHNKQISQGKISIMELLLLVGRYAPTLLPLLSIYFRWINTSASESERECSTVVKITHINTRAHNLEFGINASMVSVNKARSRKTHANKLIFNIHTMHVDKDQLIIKLFIWEFSH